MEGMEGWGRGGDKRGMEEGRDTGTGREGFGGDNGREESWKREVGMVGGTRQRDGQSWRGDGRTKGGGGGGGMGEE